MDKIVRIIGVIILVLLIFIIIGNAKLLMESFAGKRGSLNKLVIFSPRLDFKSLVKPFAFLLMVNHGPDLCVIDIRIENIPYYAKRMYIMTLGDDDDQGERTDLENVQ